MTPQCPAPFICPVCRQKLRRADRVYRCPAGHHFDIARQGYVNLLLGKRPKIQGDSRQMLLARERFLQTGHYQPLAMALVSALQDHTNTDAPLAVLDAGCGSGYYLRQMQQRFPGPLCLAGVDLSKEAARLTARLTPDTAVAVADLKQLLPIADGSIDVVLNIFAPRQPDAFARVLRPGGLLISVIPGPAHLQTVRERFQLLDIEAGKQASVRAQMAPRFQLLVEKRLQFELTLTADALADLVEMTPNAHHLTDAGRTALNAAAGMQTTAVFNLLLFRSSESG